MTDSERIPEVSLWECNGSSLYSLRDIDEYLAKIEEKYYSSAPRAQHRGWEFENPESEERRTIFLYTMKNDPGGSSSGKPSEENQRLALKKGIAGIGWGEHVDEDSSSLEEVFQDFYGCDGFGGKDSIENESIVEFLLWMKPGDIVKTNYKKDGHDIFAQIKSDWKLTNESSSAEAKELKEHGFDIYRKVDRLGIPRFDILELHSHSARGTTGRIKNGVSSETVEQLVQKFDRAEFVGDSNFKKLESIKKEIDYRKLFETLWSIEDKKIIESVGGGEYLEELVVGYVQRKEDGVARIKTAPSSMKNIEVILQGPSNHGVKPNIIGIQATSGSTDEDLEGFLQTGDVLYVYSDDSIDHKKAVNITDSELADYIRTYPSDVPLPVVERLSDMYT